MVKEVLKLGNELLYRKSSPVKKDDMPALEITVKDLHDTLFEFRARYGAGRAIAAPQIGVFKRLIYMHIDKPVVLINPSLSFDDDETMTVYDDCMCFPGLHVKISRFKRCTVRYKDIEFADYSMMLEGSLSELIQHEYDHLNGILATMRALDDRSFYLKSEHV